MKKNGEKNFLKKSHNAEKTERGTLWDFSTYILWQNIKKLKGDSFGENFIFEKNSQCRKKLKGGMVCCAEKEEKQFWITSLGQMIQFGTIKICRTFVKIFWSVRVD